MSEVAHGARITFGGHESIRDFLFDQVATNPRLRGKVSFVGEGDEDDASSYFEIEAGGAFFVVSVVAVQRRCDG